MARKPFVAPQNGGREARFSTGQKVWMVIGIIVIALAVATVVLGSGAHA